MAESSKQKTGRIAGGVFIRNMLPHYQLFVKQRGVFKWLLNQV